MNKKNDRDAASDGKCSDDESDDEMSIDSDGSGSDDESDHEMKIDED